VAILETPTGLPPKSVSALRRLRLVSTPEAISFLVLLGCSVLKRTTEFNAVPVMGLVHGVLFILYVAFWADSWRRVRWSLGRAAWMFALSILPTGGFFADRLLRRQEEAGVIATRARKERAEGPASSSSSSSSSAPSAPSAES
jgi:integral membrane protein